MMPSFVQYEPMSSKCAKSDAFGAELHLPIHTNAFNGKTSGTRIMCYALSGEGYKACKAIFDVLAPLTPGTSENITAHPELYEIKNARRSACGWCRCPLRSWYCFSHVPLFPLKL